MGLWISLMGYTPCRINKLLQSARSLQYFMWTGRSEGNEEAKQQPQFACRRQANLLFALFINKHCLLVLVA